MKKLKHLLTEAKDYAEAIGLCVVLGITKAMQRDVEQDGRPFHIFTLCVAVAILVVVLILSKLR